MPSLEDWSNSPLDVIQTLFEKHGKDYSEPVVNYFTEKLKDSKAVSWIPSLNDTPIHNLKSYSLVRFRCMIQDMFDPEFYLGVYQVVDSKTGGSKLKSGKYRDIAQCAPNQELRLESSENITLDRQTLYCVPIPGEAEWAKTAYSELSQTKATASTSQQRSDRCKRERETEIHNDPITEPTPGRPETESTGMDTGETENNETKRACRDQKPGISVQATTNLNFPLKDEKGPACLVKIYDGLENYKLNDMVEFIGVLSVDPALAIFDQSEESDVVDVAMASEEERTVHAPPPSLVPRLHAILGHKLSHNNPHLADVETDNTAAVDEIRQTVSSLRSLLLSILQHALLGDALAAEYILCHLLSTVYARVDVMPLGKFSVNLSECPKDRAFPQLLYHLISNLVTTSHKLPLTLETMNGSKFSPEKDYSANRLKSGVLQLAQDTHLVLDETVLESGQLDSKGVCNVTALGNLITWQKVEYDFSYHKQDFSTSVAALTLSEGKSLLPSDCHVPLSAEVSPDNIRTYYTQLDSHLTEENLRKLRLYITLMKQAEHNMGDDIQKKIQDDFVSIRKENPKNLTVDDFHSLLNLVRLLSLSFGLSSANMELWNKAKAMEAMRKQRLAQLPTNCNQRTH